MKITIALALLLAVSIANAQTSGTPQTSPTPKPVQFLDRPDITVEQAEKDIQKNRFRFFSVGLVSMQHFEVGKILKKEYGIEIQVAAGCVVSSQLVARVRAYNERMEKAVLKKYSKPYTQIYEEARQKLPPKPITTPQNH